MVRTKPNRKANMSVPTDSEQVVLVKKNNFGIATLMSQAVFAGLDEEMRESCESYASKKLPLRLRGCILI